MNEERLQTILEKMLERSIDLLIREREAQIQSIQAENKKLRECVESIAGEPNDDSITGTYFIRLAKNCLKEIEGE